MTTTRSENQAAQAPGATANARVAAGAANVLLSTKSPNDVSSPTSRNSTEYVHVGAAPRRAVVTPQLSKMEKILEYLKALYR